MRVALLGTGFGLAKFSALARLYQAAVSTATALILQFAALSALLKD